MKTSVVVTVLNEQNTIEKLLGSIYLQVCHPTEVIIVDGGSTDATASVISNLKSQISNKRINFKFIVKKGNRSVGRNEGIKNATGDIILISDAGCILDKDWVKNIIKPFEDPKTDVVAGYYKGISKTIFEKCLIPYVLVMEDKINSNNFLPASRSMAFRKEIWEKAGGFPEQFSNNEDYVFAQKLKKMNAKIIFEKKAIAYWIPRKNFKETFIMFFRFALGDSESGIFREKVIFIFARYALGFYFFLLSFIEKSIVPLYGVTLGIFFYILWSIKKNYKYIKDIKAFFFLPLLQFVSDFAVILGTILGLLKRTKFSSVIRMLLANKSTTIFIGIYIFLMLMLINKGIPNIHHPFTYFMDEWHQAQAVRTVYAQGSPNVPGSANGSMFHFLLVGLWLVPFIVSGIVNPFAIKSSVEAFEMQQKLFQVLRLNTLFFGILSIILIAYIAKKYFKLNPLLVSFLFVVNPIWIILSNYFKYDIALIFWILLSLIVFFEYAKKPTLQNFIVAGIISAFSLSVKISAIILFPIYVLIFFLYAPSIKRNILTLVFGFFTYVSVFLLFGIPDLLLGKGNIYEYLNSNLIRSPATTDIVSLDMHYIPFLLFRIYPLEFGHGLYTAFLAGTVFFVMIAFKKYYKSNVNYCWELLKRYKMHTILVSSFMFFILSLIPLKLGAASNRMLVLLPFIVLLTLLFWRVIFENMQKNRSKIILVIFFSFMALIQIFESFGWVYIKIMKNPQEISSVWIENNIPKNQIIGVENIPIYQYLPDIFLKEFYFKQYHSQQKNKYMYQVVDSKSIKLPNIIVITNGDIAMKTLKKSPKKDLIMRLEKDGYRAISTFYPDFTLYKIFGNEVGYYFSGLVMDPTTISVFKRY